MCGGRYLSRGSCLVQGWQEVLSGQGEKTWKSSCWPDSQGAWLSPGSILTLWGLQALTVPRGTLSPSSLEGGRESATNVLKLFQTTEPFPQSKCDTGAEYVCDWAPFLNIMFSFVFFLCDFQSTSWILVRLGIFFSSKSEAVSLKQKRRTALPL